MAKKKAKVSTTRRKKKSSVKRRTWDPFEVAEKLAPTVATMLGLDSLGLNEEQTIELLRDLLVMMMGDRVTKPKPEVLVNAIKRNESKAFAIIASKLLEIIPEGQLTPEQAEFAMAYIGPFAIRFAPRLYKEAKRLGLDLGPLQAAWEEAWRLSGDEGPVGFCPNCGFRAVAPDWTCMVCGKMLNDKEIRIATDFESKFKEFLETADCKELKEILDKGSVFVGHNSINLSRRSKWDIEVYLNREEKAMAREAFKRKCTKDISSILKKL